MAAVSYADARAPGAKKISRRHTRVHRPGPRRYGGGNECGRGTRKSVHAHGVRWRRLTNYKSNCGRGPNPGQGRGYIAAGLPVVAATHANVTHELVMSAAGGAAGGPIADRSGRRPNPAGAAFCTSTPPRTSARRRRRHAGELCRRHAPVAAQWAGAGGGKSMIRTTMINGNRSVPFLLDLS